MGKIFRERISALKLPYITTVRGKGLLNAVIVAETHPTSAWDICMRLKVGCSWLCCGSVSACFHSMQLDDKGIGMLRPTKYEPAVEKRKGCWIYIWCTTQYAVFLIMPTGQGRAGQAHPRPHYPLRSPSRHYGEGDEPGT